jgi:hypothetical protein
MTFLISYVKFRFQVYGKHLDTEIRINLKQHTKYTIMYGHTTPPYYTILIVRYKSLQTHYV